MLSSFQSDLARGKIAEQIVEQLALASGAKVIDVSDLKEYHKYGDLQVTLPTGESYFLEVKNDGVIGSSQNVLCEEEVYMKDGDYYNKGFMYNQSNYLLVVDEAEREIYIFDFKELKKIYKKCGTFKFFDYPEQSSECYLVPICRAKQYGAYIKKINY